LITPCGVFFFAVCPEIFSTGFLKENPYGTKVVVQSLCRCIFNYPIMVQEVYLTVISGQCEKDIIRSRSLKVIRGSAKTS